MPFFNTENVGPVVLEVPPADDGLFNGSIMNRWQAAIEDIGPGGVDKGRGGKYLILPPGYDVSKVPAGYLPMRSDTHLGYALIRSVLRSGGDADVAKAVAYSKRLKLYPLSQAANPPPTVFVDAADVVFDSTIPYDMRFFESLDRMVQAEFWLERDKAMIDPLKSIGIERGKPFKPDAKTQAILSAAIQEAKTWFEARYETLPPFYEGQRWFFPSTAEMIQNVMSDWRTPDSYPIDARGTAYTLAFFSAKHLGESQYYLLTGNDKDGKPLDGKASYRLHVPANAPVTQYWSMTVYDRATHAFIKNAAWVGRSSQTPGLKKNADGSADIYFWPARAGWTGNQLGPDRSPWPLRGARALLRSAEAAVRQNVEVAGHRTNHDTVTSKGPKSSTVYSRLTYGSAPASVRNSGALGETANVSHTFQPAARCSSANSL